jgi:aminoglycoside 6'-N-acetyltransferase
MRRTTASEDGSRRQATYQVRRQPKFVQARNRCSASPRSRYEKDEAGILIFMTHALGIPDQINGGAVCLRPIVHNDRTLIYRWLNNPVVMALWEGANRPLSETESAGWVERFVGDDASLDCLIIETVERPIGFIELSRYPESHTYQHLVEIDICIGETSEWERGYGSAALLGLLHWLFTSTNTHRAFLQPRAANERAVHVYEKVGFRKEGVLKQAEYHHGEYHDTVMMAAIRGEWLAEFSIKCEYA